MWWAAALLSARVRRRPRNWARCEVRSTYQLFVMSLGGTWGHGHDTGSQCDTCQFVDKSIHVLRVIPALDTKVINTKSGKSEHLQAWHSRRFSEPKDVQAESLWAEVFLGCGSRSPNDPLPWRPSEVGQRVVGARFVGSP